jgi:hypothetical protein
VSAKVPTNTSSNITNTKDVQPSKSRDNTVEPQQRIGTSAYINQSEYDVYKQQSTTATKQIVDNGAAYTTYTQTNPNDNQKNRHDDDDDDDYSNEQQYTKPSTTSYSGQFGRSNSYNNIQPKVASNKPRNISSGSALYHVIILKG